MAAILHHACLLVDCYVQYIQLLLLLFRTLHQSFYNFADAFIANIPATDVTMLLSVCNRDFAPNSLKSRIQ